MNKKRAQLKVLIAIPMLAMEETLPKITLKQNIVVIVARMFGKRNRVFGLMVQTWKL